MGALHRPASLHAHYFARSWQPVVVELPPQQQHSLGARLDIYFRAGLKEKLGDFHRGTVAKQLGGEWYEIAFDDKERDTLNLSPDSNDWWRLPPEEEPEPPEKRRQALNRAQREMQRRDWHLSLQQERDDGVELMHLMLDERRRHAAELERQLANAHTVRRIEVSRDEWHGILLGNGLVVMAAPGTAPLEAQQQVTAYASRRCAELLRTNPDGAKLSPADWLTEVLPHVLHERERLRVATALVALAGCLDQEGAGEEMVRVLFDDFVFEHAPPRLVHPLGGASHTGRLAEAAETQLTLVAWPQSCETLRCLAAPTPDLATASHEPHRPHGALRSANLFVFPKPMPRGGKKVTSLGPPIELVTGVTGWRITAAFSPKRMAHCNALLGAGDVDGSATVRLVPFTTSREEAAVKRARSLPARSHDNVQQVLAAEMQCLQQMQPRTAPPTARELFEGVRKVLIGPTAIATADGATGGASLNLGRRVRAQTGDHPVITTALNMDDAHIPLLRTVHFKPPESAHTAGELASLTAPVLGQAADDIAQVWPSILTDLSNGLSARAFDKTGGLAFPPRVLQRAGLNANGAMLETAELVVRINRVPYPSEKPSEADLLALMRMPCGLHSDDGDTDSIEVIIYVHHGPGESSGGSSGGCAGSSGGSVGSSGGTASSGGGASGGASSSSGNNGGSCSISSSGRGGSNIVGSLGLNLRLVGGATLTRGQRKRAGKSRSAPLRTGLS